SRPARAICFDDEVESNVWVARPPSFIAGPESVMMPDWDLPPLCTFCQRFLRQLTEKVSDCNVTFLNPGGACRCNRNDDICFRGKAAPILATQAYGLVIAFSACLHPFTNLWC